MIAIIGGCGNNLTSVQMALARLDYTSEITTCYKKIQQASHVILPGVGNARAALTSLKALDLINCIVDLQQPVLGICLGMQILFQYSAEGDVAGLGVFPGEVSQFDYQPGLPVPHMGWSLLQSMDKADELLLDIPQQCYVYFVHSYFAPLNQYTQANAQYGTTFSAIVKKDNFCGMQFHPERSGRIGHMLLTNFLNLTR